MTTAMMSPTALGRIGARLYEYMSDHLDVASETRKTTPRWRETKARLDGALEIAAIALSVSTPFSIELDLRESINSHGRRPTPTGQNGPAIREWMAVVVAEFVALHRGV